MTSQTGYLKLLITRSILSGPLDFEIKRVACIRKLGNRRSSEGLRSFKPSKAGDIEMNPGPRFQCGLCKKYCKALDRLLECEECEKRFHASCSNLGDNEFLRTESVDGA